MATVQRREKTETATKTKAASIGIQGAWWKWGTGLLMAYVCYGAFFVAGGNVNFGAGADSARILFFHVPAAILSYVAYAVGFVYALRYLTKSPTPETDEKSAIAMELGFLFCILATITGSIFAGAVWGDFWNWDPRETSIVIMLLLYASYLVLRQATREQPEKRAKFAAIYAIIVLIPATYLIWVAPRIAPSNHPPNTLWTKSGMSSTYRLVLYPSFIAFTMLFVWLFQLRFRLFQWRRKG